jgi:hypothetical protein
MTPIAVVGTRRAMREMADGTIRVQIDIDPKYRDRFLELFSQIDMPVALAQIDPAAINPASGSTDGFDETLFMPDGIDAAQIVTFTVSDTEAKEIGGSTWAALGALCQSAIMLGKSEPFQQWVSSQGAVVRTSTPGATASPEECAAYYIRERCGVESRKQLDESDEAKAKFRDMMRAYRTWLRQST